MTYDVNVKTTLDGRDLVIIETIDNYLEGISFNKLAVSVVESMSKVTLSNRIKKLKDVGLLIESKDPNHRQKKVYKSTSSMKELVNIFRKIDEWEQSLREKLSKIEILIDQGDDEKDIDIISEIAQILGEVGIPMMYVLQIKLRYNFESAMLIVPNAIEAASTILERVIELLDSHPKIEDQLSIYANSVPLKSIVKRVKEHYLPKYEGKIEKAD